jgi:exonuclease III
MRFGTWNVSSICRAGSFRAVAEEISKYKLDLVGVQEVRLDGGGAEPVGKSRGMKIMKNIQVFSYIRESYQELRV